MDRRRLLTLFLAGDVMLGRGIDQVLPHSVDPRLYEAYVKSAERYVALAEAEHGPIPAPVPFDYVWGDALTELERVAPSARVINLETAVTTADSPWPRKGIHYRMHPENVPVLTAAADVCVLGNNHVMDWGRAGLRETLATLRAAGLATAGAGESARLAAGPAVVETGQGRLLVFSYGLTTAGVPPGWEATPDEAGVNLLPSLDDAAADRVIGDVADHRREADRVVVSIHWGPNWGYDVSAARRRFAHRLIDAGAADIIHGHSSHHPKGIEVYRGRPILYGAGDFLNDYEGIGGREEYRGDLTLMYFPALAPSGELVGLRMTPMRIRRFRLEQASAEETAWLAETLDGHSRPLGTRVAQVGDRLEVSTRAARTVSAPAAEAVDPARALALRNHPPEADTTVETEPHTRRRDPMTEADFEPETLEPLELRVARITDAREHPNADRLILVDIDLGYETRQLVAGIAGKYAFDELVGRNIVVVANLQAAKLRGELSQGMLLAAQGEDRLGLLFADAEPGTRLTTASMGEPSDQKITIDDFAVHELMAGEDGVTVDGEPLEGAPITVDRGVVGPVR